MSKYVAKPYIAGTPEAMVIGQTVLAFAENIEAEKIKPILPKHGLDNIDPEEWYPHQNWMNVLKELDETLGEQASTTFIAFGKKVVETAVMPPEIKTIPDVLNLLHDIHHLNLRNIPDEEGYSIEKKGEKHYWVYHNTPNPDVAIYGFIWGLVARYKQPHEVFIVQQIENPNPEEKPGSVFEVKWGNTTQEIN